MIEFKVDGMTCQHCARAVTQAVKSVDPQADVRVDLDAGRVSVNGRGSAETLSKAIRDAGYTALPAGASH